MLKLIYPSIFSCISPYSPIPLLLSPHSPGSGEVRTRPLQLIFVGLTAMSLGITSRVLGFLGSWMM